MFKIIDVSLSLQISKGMQDLLLDLLKDRSLMTEDRLHQYRLFDQDHLTQFHYPCTH